MNENRNMGLKTATFDEIIKTCDTKSTRETLTKLDEKLSHRHKLNKNDATFISSLVDCLPKDVLDYSYDINRDYHIFQSNLLQLEINFPGERFSDSELQLRALLNSLITAFDPDKANLLIFMLRHHSDRITKCETNPSLRLTANRNISIDINGACDHKNRLSIAPVDVLQYFLGYPRYLAERALLGDESAVEEFNRLPESQFIPTSALSSVSQNYPRRDVSSVPFLLNDIPKELWSLLKIPQDGECTKLTFSSTDQRYYEEINLLHTNCQRERYSLTIYDYFGMGFYKNVPTTEFYILSSIVDIIRFVIFFHNIGELAGKVFISIGTNSRIDAALHALSDINTYYSNASVYLWARNRDSCALRNTILKQFPDVISLGEGVKDEFYRIEYDEKLMLQVVPEKYRTMPSVK